MLVREGDVVDGRYRLLKVGVTSIVMAYLDGQGQQIIPLTGGRGSVGGENDVETDGSCRGRDRPSGGMCHGRARSAAASKPRGRATGTRPSPITGRRSSTTPAAWTSRLRCSALRLPRRPSTWPVPKTSKRRSSGRPRRRNTSSPPTWIPANIFAAAKATAIERKLREELEALRPVSRMDTLREQARQVPGMPTLIDPTVPINLRITNTSVREILTTIGTMAGINVTFVEQPTIEQQLREAVRWTCRGNRSRRLWPRC